MRIFYKHYYIRMSGFDKEGNRKMNYWRIIRVPFFANLCFHSDRLVKEIEVKYNKELDISIDVFERIY